MDEEKKLTEPQFEKKDKKKNKAQKSAGLTELSWQMQNFIQNKKGIMDFFSSK